MTLPNVSDLVFDEPRSLPVLLLLDVSSSMGDEDPKGSQKKKIDYLNLAVREMLEALRDFKGAEEQFHVGAITFGRTVSLVQPFQNVRELVWSDVQAGGVTPLGPALEFTKQRFEDRSFFPQRSCRPYVILVSDGVPTDTEGLPTDKWKKPFADFIGTGRSSKSFRMAVAIGKDADQKMLNEFIDGSEEPLFYAENAADIRNCFKRISMTTVRIASQTGSPADTYETKSETSSTETSQPDTPTPSNDPPVPPKKKKNYW